MAIFSLLAALFGLLFVVLAFVFWIWMLIDCIKNERLTDTQKVVWVLVIIFLHALGALIYLLTGRK
jgi:cytochrome c oxidase assembly factor CtaG